MSPVVTEPRAATDDAPTGGPLPASLYRFGFLVLPASRPLAVDAEMSALAAGWVRSDLGDLVLWSHPETRLAAAERGDTRLVVIGEAYANAGHRMEDLLAGAPVATDAELGALGDRLGGRFALLATEAGGFRILHDAFGSRSVFYTPREPRAVASHAQLLAQALGIPRSQEIAKLIADENYTKRKVKYLPGDHTVFEEVFALIPNNLYDSSIPGTRRYWPVSPKRRTSFSDLLAATNASFDAMVPFVTARYRPLFGITGGIDSRTLIGAFRRRGAPMAGVTWGGGFLDRAEMPAVERLVSELGVEQKYLDMAKKRPGEAAEISLRNGGGYRNPSRLTQGMAEAYPGGAGSVFIRGYGGEIIRGFYNISKRPMADFSAAAMTGAYDIGGRIPAHAGRIRGMFEDFRLRGNYGAVETLGYDPNDIFYWEHRMGMWGACMLNEMDAAMPSLVGFNDRALYAAAFGLPDKERLTKRILHRLLVEFDPAIAALDPPAERGAPAASAAGKPQATSRARSWSPGPGLLVRVKRKLGRLKRTLFPPVSDRKPAPVVTGGYASGAYGRSRADLLYYQYFRFMVHCLGPDARSMIDVGSGNVPYLEWFDWIPRRVSVDIRVPYSSDSVQGIQGDIHTLDLGGPFDLCTCMQVLEHIREPAPFAQRLLALGRLVLVSVPYKWPKGRTKGHVQDPVDLDKLSGWFGRRPNYHLVVQEPFAGPAGARLFALYDPANPDRRFGPELRKNRRPL